VCRFSTFYITPGDKDFADLCLSFFGAGIFCLYLSPDDKNDKITFISTMTARIPNHRIGINTTAL
jgi:hypothetical protein